LSLSHWEYQEVFKGIDYCIIGAGIVGSCTAIFLKEQFPDANILILERGFLPRGASTKNAGFACFGSVSEILDDHEHMSRDEIRDLIKLRIDGLNLLKSLCPTSVMDYHEWGGYEVFDDAYANVYVEKIKSYNDLVESASGLKNCFSIQASEFGLNFGKHMIFNKYEGQLNPVKMLFHLHDRIQKEGTRILFGAQIHSYEASENKPSVTLENGTQIQANKLVFCTNAFSKKFFPDFNVQAARNQVMVTKPIEGLKLKGTFHYDKGYVYFRNIGNRLLIGGARNLDAETETTEQFGSNELIKAHLRKMVNEKILPGVAVRYEKEWSGIIAVGDTKVPHIKKINDQCFAAFRLGGMGVAIGSKVAESLTNLISNKDNIN